MSDPLREYRERRDVDATPEPAGEVRPPSERPLLVVQQHDASSMHFDVRVETDGVLASWAVPKGPSTDPRDKRLAVRTEDHPLDYADFEGAIAEDEYGGGKVIVWDLGPYRNVTTDDDGEEVPVPDAIENGYLEIQVEGEKLQGRFRFVHARLQGDPKNWLLMKVDDEHADARRNPVSTQPRSVLSDRKVDEVEDDPEEGDS
jgi:DNA ligase D-like protein (predicted 3'-phosphoesterase)